MVKCNSSQLMAYGGWNVGKDSIFFKGLAILTMLQSVYGQHQWDLVGFLEEKVVRIGGWTWEDKVSVMGFIVWNSQRIKIVIWGKPKYIMYV